MEKVKCKNCLNFLDRIAVIEDELKIKAKVGNYLFTYDGVKHYLNFLKEGLDSSEVEKQKITWKFNDGSFKESMFYFLVGLAASQLLLWWGHR